MAAAATCDRLCHSLHAYFLRGGDIREPIEYRVERLRDGHSVQTREVRAYQRDQLIYVASLSFSHREKGLEFQREAPSALKPLSLKPETELLEAMQDKIPEKFRARALRPRHVEIRPTELTNPFRPVPQDPRQSVYMRCLNPQQQKLRGREHQALLAFMSDYMLLGSALLPHGISFWSEPRLQAATIDHSLHFHREFYADDFMLYSMKSDTSSEGRGLADGRFWQHGKLVATTRQEGLIRVREKRDQDS